MRQPADKGKPKKKKEPRSLDAVEPPELFSTDEVTVSEPGQAVRLRDVPFRMLVPSMITLGAICSGLTGVRMAWEGRFELAIVAVVFAAILDGIDGRVARFLKSTSNFGEQMDSLADFVNFGVAPAMILYLWILHEARSLGWVVALIFAMCGCLRLARFNVMLEAPDKPQWHVNFFMGVPSPAGALLALMPVYLGNLDMEKTPLVLWFSMVYVIFVGFLMVSNIPTWSGKLAGQRVSGQMVLPVMLGAILLVVFLFSFPWLSLTAAGLVYLVSIPFSHRDYRMKQRQQ